MTEAKFKTMRHIETLRNYLNTIIKELLHKQEHHDQSKMESFEVDTFEEYTPRLRGLTYGSDEYKQCMKEMKPAIKHHQRANKGHHPEGNIDGINGMNLIDMIEMICDWKAATLRHGDGDIYKSIEINQKRFGYSDDLRDLFINTATFLDQSNTFHKAEES